MTSPSRLVISEIMGGQQTYEKPFFLQNDTFPTLINALCWRKRLMKKPGSQLLGQLRRQIGTTTGGTFTTKINPVPLSHGVSKFQIGNVVLVDGDISVNDVANLTSNTLGYTGQLDRGINAITGGTVTINLPVILSTPVYYYPGIPVMGIEQFESDKSPNTQIDFPTNVFFDTTYSYQYDGTNFFDVSFYKVTGHSVYWTGLDYQQFDSTNYYRAMFVTNNKPGMQFVTISAISAAATASITTSVNHNLTTGDIVFINETTGTDKGNLNGHSFTVTVTGANTFTVPASTAGGIGNVGIVQYMTQLSPTSTGDGIRWYDGDPLGGNAPHTLGWVNFAPPLDNLQSSSTTYLLGARIIIPFGNRLLAIGTYEDTSANASSPAYYGNRIRYCEVSSTPFYSLPVPNTIPTTSVEPNAWASNIQGFGGFVDLDTTERIISATITQGALILGLEREQRRVSLTGIETDPFSIQIINPEYGTAGTHAVVPMDKSIVTAGEYGFLMTSSYDAKRFDEKIIDQIFQVNQTNNGYERICGGRDFVNEVIYFTYYSDSAVSSNKFPDTTVVYNYREGSFSTWYETFTTYGLYKNSTAQTWTKYFEPWATWTTAWQDLGSDRYSKPLVAAGTPQGYVMTKWAESSFNDPSLFIQAISINADGITYTITSPNHNLYGGAYIGFWPGIPSTGTPIQSFNGSVDRIIDINQFVVTFGPGAAPASIVPGVWQMSIVDQIDILTKQFQFAWSANKKTRIGAQKYFLDTTANGEFIVNIYGSQSLVSLDDPSSASIISSNIVRTRPDDSLGLNDNAATQQQIWHRLPSSAIGDTVQLEFTLSNDQMLNVNVSTAPWTLYATVLDLYPSRMLA